MYGVELNQLSLDVLQGLHLILDVEAVTQWKHPEGHPLETEAFSPLSTDGRRKAQLEVLQLVLQVVDLLMDHVLLLGSTGLHAASLLLGQVAEVLEELLDLVDVEVVVADSPYMPVEVLLELEVLPGDHQTVEASWLHLSQPPTHFDLFLNPVSISKVEQLDHELNFSVDSDLVEVVQQLGWPLVFEGAQTEASDVLLEARHVQFLVVQLQDLLPLYVTGVRCQHWCF